MGPLFTNPTQFAHFCYDWRENDPNGHWIPSDPDQQYTPVIGYYNSDSEETWADELADALYAHINLAVRSDWSLDGSPDAFLTHERVTRFMAYVDSSRNTVYRNYKVAQMYEMESQGSPTEANILAYLESVRTNRGGFNCLNRLACTKKSAPTEVVNDAIDVWVYQMGDNAAADRWLNAVEDFEAAHPGESIHLRAEIWTGFLAYNRIGDFDSLFKYQPAGDGSYIDSQVYPYVLTVTPGFYNPPGAVAPGPPFLERSESEFAAAVGTAADAYEFVETYGDGAHVQTIAVATYSEWMEHSNTRRAYEFPHAYDGRLYSRYLEITRDRFPDPHSGLPYQEPTRLFGAPYYQTR